MVGLVPRIRTVLLKMPFPEKMKALIDHPAGPLTIFFWAPTFKWMITVANIKDFSKPAENISINQQAAILLTGIIWSRYSLVINPVNFNLLSVNLAMACTAAYQIYRRILVNRNK